MDHEPAPGRHGGEERLARGGFLELVSERGGLGENALRDPGPVDGLGHYVAKIIHLCPCKRIQDGDRLVLPAEDRRVRYEGPLRCLRPRAARAGRRVDRHLVDVSGGQAGTDEVRPNFGIVRFRTARQRWVCPRGRIGVRQGEHAAGLLNRGEDPQRPITLSIPNSLFVSVTVGPIAKREWLKRCVYPLAVLAPAAPAGSSGGSAQPMSPSVIKVATAFLMAISRLASSVRPGGGTRYPLASL